MFAHSLFTYHSLPVRHGNCSCAVSKAVDMPNRHSRWDQEAACQDGLIASFCSYIAKESGLTTFFFVERVCVVCGYVFMGSVWDLLAHLPGLLALRIEATPAFLPLLPNIILLNATNVGSGRKILSPEWGKLPWKSRIWPSFFFF